VGSADNLLRILPIILSSFAILISLISLWFSSYNQYFKKPNIRIFIADAIDSWLDPEGELVFNVSVTIFNNGAQYGAISRIHGRIISEHSDQAMPFDWRIFVEHKNVAAEGTRFIPFATFAGWAHALVIPARQAVIRTIQFVTQAPLVLQPGIYKFEFEGFLGESPKPRARSSITLRLDEEQLEKLAQTRVDPDTRVSTGSVRLRSHIPSK
jgi:hypothetical protein